jgi:DNA-binding transcriptional LysR family regulator
MIMKEIEALATIVRSKNFYEAAFALNYSPSVISKYVAAAEMELGVVLFNRSNRAASISLTKEGAALLPHISALYENYCRLKTHAAALRGKNDRLLRIGTGLQLSALGMDEILAGFFAAHPEIRVEQLKLDFEALVHSLYSGSLDGVFLLVQDGSFYSDSLKKLLRDPKLDAYLLVRECEMFLGISENHPLAQKDAAPLRAFSDFSVAFHSDETILTKAGTMSPFLRLSEKSGFQLKPLFIDPRDSSAFLLAAQTKLAIPSLRCLFRYPGVKFVRVEDWDSFSASYFVGRKNNQSTALAQLIKTVRAYAIHE